MQLELITHQPTSANRAVPILFVHGAWHGAWCWEEHFMPYFAQQGFATYALSFRGHGKSKGRDTILRNLARHYVQDVSQITQQIEQQTGTLPIIIGHSLGGYVTQKFLEQQQLPAAVLLASIPPYGTLPFFLRFGEVRRTAQAYQAEVEIFPDMAHDMMLEKDWQRVADRIITWLDKRGL